MVRVGGGLAFCFLNSRVLKALSPPVNNHPLTLRLVHLYPSPAIIWCSRAASALVRVKMMVWPSFSQLGKIWSCRTLVLSAGVGQLGGLRGRGDDVTGTDGEGCGLQSCYEGSRCVLHPPR
jgi:hypothetical protein